MLENKHKNKLMAKNKSDSLYDAIIVSVEISCNNCRKTNTIHECDEFDACDSFYEDGWRMTRAQNVYCPECAKIKLKNP